MVWGHPFLLIRFAYMCLSLSSLWVCVPPLPRSPQEVLFRFNTWFVVRQVLLEGGKKLLEMNFNGCCLDNVQVAPSSAQPSLPSLLLLSGPAVIPYCTHFFLGHTRQPHPSCTHIRHDRQMQPSFETECHPAHHCTKAAVVLSSPRTLFV